MRGLGRAGRDRGSRVLVRHPVSPLGRSCGDRRRFDRFEWVLGDGERSEQVNKMQHGMKRTSSFNGAKPPEKAWGEEEHAQLVLSMLVISLYVPEKPTLL